LLYLHESGYGRIEMRFYNVSTPEEVIQIIQSRINPLSAERIPLGEAGGRICAETIYSTEDVPAFDRSTVDGYAVRSMDTFGASDSAPALLTVTGEIEMGAQALPLGKDSCAYIPTGGMLPPGADAVVMVEHCETIENLVTVHRPVAPGENVIRRGEDFQKGEEIVEKGKLLRAQDLGALAAAGIRELPVTKRPTVGILSSGNELVPYETESLPSGKVRDCNALMIGELCRKKGAEILFGGISPDDPGIFRKRVEELLEQTDFVVLSGGSSVGTRDFTVQVLGELTEASLLVEGIAIQPGKPTLFSICQGKPVMGLPGHPVSAMSIFLLFGTRVIDALSGKTVPPFQPVVPAVLAQNIPSRIGRTDSVRVRLEQKNGLLYATPIFGRSGLLRTLTHAHGFILVPSSFEGIASGETVSVILYGMNTYE
jgi:molybdopterin molybdotransferase